MDLRVGITTSDLTQLTHGAVTIACISSSLPHPSRSSPLPAKQSSAPLVVLKPGQSLDVTCKQGKLAVSLPSGNHLTEQAEKLSVSPSEDGILTISSIKRSHGAARTSPRYRGRVELIASSSQIRIVLICDLEDYIKGVLQSEIPSSYHAEAIKAQAVAARTYALRPRLDHSRDLCMVCDSYLCCQYFAGVETISPAHLQAISDTKGKVLVFEDKPILALFSSCAGGHTENYDNCFSEPITNRFPPAALPYLVGMSETEFNQPVARAVTESDLRRIWHDSSFRSVDSWSPHFRWRLTLKAASLEAHMHEEVRKMLLSDETKPFVEMPQSGEFGLIKSFSVSSRGVAGTAIVLSVETSRGVWKFTKELVIRSLFKNPELKLSRLKSARIFIDLQKDQRGLLSHVTISGLGWGHGVGMQQTGAQGWARAGKNYQQILQHYFQHAAVVDV